MAYLMKIKGKQAQKHSASLWRRELPELWNMAEIWH